MKFLKKKQKREDELQPSGKKKKKKNLRKNEWGNFPVICFALACDSFRFLPLSNLILVSGGFTQRFVGVGGCVCVCGWVEVSTISS